MLKNIIRATEYCQRNHTITRGRDVHSISFLIEKSLSQHQCIRLGTAVEKVLLNLIEKMTHFKSIKPKNVKNQHEFDHLFVDEKNKKIVYAELKSNLNLDTEKVKATMSKCKSNATLLKEKYESYEIEWCLLGLRYTRKSEIPKIIENKFSDISLHLFGVLDYLELFELEHVFSCENEMNYKEFLNDIVKVCFFKEEMSLPDDMPLQLSQPNDLGQ